MALIAKKVDVSTFLQKKQQEAGDEIWADFENLYNKRLWHQLTVKLLSFVKREELKPEEVAGLYENFIADFETKMKPLYLVEIVALLLKYRNDTEGSLAFLDSLKEKVKADQHASILTSILSGRIKLETGDVAGVKKMLEEVSPLVDEEPGVTPVHGRFFQLSSDYHLLMGNHNEYYREALRYLGCTKLEDESKAATKKRAFALALAALLGESVFNFGELLQHPIINTLRESDPWVIDLLFAFNAGDIAKYEQLAPQWKKQPDLQAHELPLRKKITLLCLMEMTFKSPSGILTFQEIASQAHLPVPEVELLVMKALSLNLIKGTIDEVEQNVHLTWVQPRVLDKAQIGSLRSKLDNWCRDVQKMERLMEGRAKEMIL
ncbi:26S proteasome non-ATPase regulatory subunit 13 [Halotydeus destructor]|nr:26S proteasome non-ATPase regulatory subunit 13 [Halotydeus destructor]